jgi:hypothetical protein
LAGFETAGWHRLVVVGGVVSPAQADGRDSAGRRRLPVAAEGEGIEMARSGG